MRKCIHCKSDTWKKCGNQSCNVPVCIRCQVKWLCQNCRTAGVKVNRLTLGRKKRKVQKAPEVPLSMEPPIITSKAKLNKVIRESEGLQEHVFKPQNESWVGDWEKCGQDFRFDNHAKALFSCSSCEGDRLKRNFYKINQKKNRTYAVDNWTKPGDIWPWEFGLCDNKECWGPYKRTMKIQRRGNLYRISTYKKLKSTGCVPERIDQLYVRLMRNNGKCSHIYSGISKPVGICHIFWPLLSDEKDKRYHIYTELISRDVLPENCINLPHNEWLSCYYYDNNLNYPNRMEFRIFEEIFPAEEVDTIRKLEKCGWPEIGRAYAFMYPGGAGCRLEFYKYKEGPHPRKRRDTFFIPFYWERGTEGYIENVQAGWTGPIISYWKRTSIENPFFP